MKCSFSFHFTFIALLCIGHKIKIKSRVKLVVVDKMCKKESDNEQFCFLRVHQLRFSGRSLIIDL